MTTDRDTAHARTRLGWQRTALGQVVLGLLLLRQGWSRESWPVWIAGLLAITCAAACARSAGPPRRPTTSGLSRPLLLTAGVLIVCGLTSAGVLTG
ncbi:hypothetical protein ACU610_05770 [Geodermatophilus sp. URMC 61]|uniref:hypothetical protein n=1 Tax=Geodermatophilus sp. URMC 61 TaxID=3423411 RepID=UPI00406D43F6